MTSEGTRLRGEQDNIPFYTILFFTSELIKTTVLAAIGQHFQESEKNFLQLFGEKNIEI